MSEEKARAEESIEETLRRVLAEEPRPLVVFPHDHDALLADIKKLLEEQRPLVRCRFAEQDGDGLPRMLTGGGDRCAPLRYLRSWLKGATRLTIADPYFLHADAAGWAGLSDKEKKRRAEDYAKEVRQVLGGIKKVEVFHLPGPPKPVTTAMRKVAWKDRSAKLIETTEIHDRVCIRDGDDARIVGTSFGSIGRKLAFIVQLPDEDRKAFLRKLGRIRSSEQRRERNGN